MAVTNPQDVALQGDRSTPQQVSLTKYIETSKFADQVIASHPRVFEMDEAARTAMVRRFVALTRSEIKRNDALANADQSSVLIAILDAAKMGLEPGPHKHLYLVPFKGQATLIIDARGWAELGRRAGFKSPQAGPIHKNDIVDFAQGSNKHFSITWDITKDRGPIVAYYAYVETQDGEPYFEIVSLETIEKHRNASPSKDSAVGPWTKWPEEMANKSAIKILYRLLPISEEIEYAMNVDETVADSSDPADRSRYLDLEPEPDEPQRPPQKQTQRLASELKGKAEQTQPEPPNTEAPKAERPPTEPPASDVGTPEEPTEQKRRGAPPGPRGIYKTMQKDIEGMLEVRGIDFKTACDAFCSFVVYEVDKETGEEIELPANPEPPDGILRGQAGEAELGDILQTEASALREWLKGTSNVDFIPVDPGEDDDEDAEFVDVDEAPEDDEPDEDEPEDDEPEMPDVDGEEKQPVDAPNDPLAGLELSDAGKKFMTDWFADGETVESLEDYVGIPLAKRQSYDPWFEKNKDRVGVVVAKAKKSRGEE